jgi:hypothetical protein
MVWVVQPEIGAHAAPEHVEAAIVVSGDRVVANSFSQVVQLETVLQVKHDVDAG